MRARIEITGARLISMPCRMEIGDAPVISIHSRMEITQLPVISMQPRMEITRPPVISIHRRMEITGRPVISTHAWIPITGAPVIATRRRARITRSPHPGTHPAPVWTSARHCPAPRAGRPPPTTPEAPWRVACCREVKEEVLAREGQDRGTRTAAGHAPGRPADRRRYRTCEPKAPTDTARLAPKDRHTHRPHARSALACGLLPGGKGGGAGPRGPGPGDTDGSRPHARAPPRAPRDRRRPSIHYPPNIGSCSPCSRAHSRAI